MSTSDILHGSVQDTDKAVGFFNDIFGTGWQNILDGQSPEGGASGVLFNLFHSFGAVTLAAVTVLMFYIVSAGLVGTAHEGEALGKRYSTLWTPIRSALAISLLLPLPWCKVSMMQAFILKFVMLSISGANYLANDTVEFMVKQGGVVSAIAAPMPLADGLAEEMLKNMVIQEYFKSREDISYGGNGITDTSSTAAGNALTAMVLKEYDVKSFIFSPPKINTIDVTLGEGDMGRIKTSCLGIDASLCDKEHSLAIEMANSLRPIARALVSQWVNGDNTPMDATQEQAFREAVDTYRKGSYDALSAQLDALSSQNNPKLTELSQSVKNNGWTWLGVYYWKIAAINEEAQQKIQTKASISEKINEDDFTRHAGPEFASVMDRYEAFIVRIFAGRQKQMALAATGSNLSGMWALMNSFFTDALDSSFSVPGLTGNADNNNTAMTGGANILARVIAKGDPIRNLQYLGHQLINTGSNLLVAPTATHIASKAVKTAGRLVSWVPVVGKSADKAAQAIGDEVAKISGFLMPVVLALLISGVTLAYYLPALPFILWTSAVVGWLILTMELMVAAFIWAAMHAIPEGEGMAGQHGRQGYMLFLGILMRPALHVIGFVMSFVIISVIGNFVGESYLDFTTASAQDDAPFGPISQMIGWLATVLLGAGIMIVATHKTFSLITWLPDNILRWAGNNSPSLGEHNDEQRTSQVFAAALTRTQGAITGAAGAAKAGAAKDASKDIMPTGRPGRPTSHNLSQGDKN
jgi:conjugal transfer/type IV secretion protein DotA/TraY